MQVIIFIFLLLAESYLHTCRNQTKWRGASNPTKSDGKFQNKHSLLSTLESSAGNVMPIQPDVERCLRPSSNEGRIVHA